MTWIWFHIVLCSMELYSYKIFRIWFRVFSTIWNIILCRRLQWKITFCLIGLSSRIRRQMFFFWSSSSNMKRCWNRKGSYNHDPLLRRVRLLNEREKKRSWQNLMPASLNSLFYINHSLECHEIYNMLDIWMVEAHGGSVPILPRADNHFTSIRILLSVLTRPTIAGPSWHCDVKWT